MKNIYLCCLPTTKNYLFLGIFMLFMQSCDCLQKVEGNVYDAQNMKVLSDVVIYKKGQSYSSIKTDTNGSFKFSDIDGGRNCSEVSLVFEKLGYKSDTIVFSANTVGAEVKLIK